nr:uncharacterized protein LOC106678900 isoform X2 [Halyomorpha halys]
MEVYATIFIIFVSHVLSSFSSRQRDGTHIPYSKIRRMPIVHFQNHNNDEENQQDIALEYVLPLTAGVHRAKIANGNSNRNTQYDADKIINSGISNVNSQKGLKNFIDYNTFASRSEKIKLSLRRKKKYSVTTNENTFSNIITKYNSTSNQPSNYLTSTIEAHLTEFDKSKNNISTTTISLSESWANRAKMKYITVRPWNQFCLTCNTPLKIKDNCVTTKPTCRTTNSEDLCITFTKETTCYPKRKKTSKPCYSTPKFEQRGNVPWLFFSDPTKCRSQSKIPCCTTCRTSTPKCTTKPITCRKLRNFHLNSKINDYMENYFIRMPRKKKRNYLLDSKSQLGILKSSLKRYKKGPIKSRLVSDALLVKTPMLIRDIKSSEKQNLVPFDLNFSNNNLLTRINKLKKRSLTDFRKGKKYKIVGMIPIRQNKDDKNMTGAIPSYQKSCFYNLTGLVNAKTIKPPEYFKKQPTLLLCCEDDYEDLNVSSVSTSSTGLRASNELDVLEGTTNVTNTTDSPVTGISDTTGSLVTTVSSTISTVTPLFRMVMQLRNMTTSRGVSVSHKPKEKFYLKLLIQNKVGLKDSKGNMLESELDKESFNGIPILSYVLRGRNSKKPQPWNSGKFCSTCSGGKKGQSCNFCTDNASHKNVPWDTTCCYSSSKATGKNRKITSKRTKSTSMRNKSTKSGSKSSTKGGKTTSSVSGGTSSGAEATSSGAEATSSGSMTTSRGSKTTISKGKATKKRGKTTIRRRKVTNKRVKTKVKTTATYPPNASTLQFLVENKLLRSLSSLITSTEKVVKHHLFKEHPKSLNILNNINPKFGDGNILLLLRVPFAVAQKYSENGNLGLVLPLNDTSFPKYIKPRSIFGDLLPSLLRKTTQVHYLLPTSADNLSLLTTSSYSRTGSTNEPPLLLNLNVHKRMTKACPSCLKKRKELVFETTYGDKKANCIIDDNNLLYEQEIDSDYSNSYEVSTEECDGKLFSYLLKYPKTMTTPSAHRESQSARRGLTILHSHDSPPKYFIEVPESFAEMMSGDRNTPMASPTVSQIENYPPSQRPLGHGSRRKPIVLCLQPFGINGHNVYLPMAGSDKSIKSKIPYIGRNIVAGEYSDDITSTSSSKSVINGFLGKNDSFLPFALIPAYLAMHPSKPLSSESSKTKDPPVTARDYQKSYLDNVSSDNSLKKDEDIALTLLLNNFPIEKKPLKLSKQVKGSKMTPKPALPKKSSRKSASDKPTYIILMKGAVNDPFLEDFDIPLDQIDYSTLGQEGGIFMEPLGEYVN